MSTLPQDSANPPSAWQPLAWLAGLVALPLVMAFVPVPSRLVQALGAIVVTAIYVGLIIGFVVSATRRSSLRALLIGIDISLIIWIGLQRLPLHLLPPIILDPLTSAALTSSAVFLGALLGRFLIRTPNMLGPICALIALIDIWGVLFGGIVAQLLARAPDVARRAMTKGPSVGAATTSHYIIALPSVGIGDYLFLGLLFASLTTLGLNVKGAWKWVWPLMALALLFVMFRVAALPGLLFIGLGVAIPNWKYFRYTREEKFALLYAGIFVVILTVVMYFMLMSLLATKMG